MPDDEDEGPGDPGRLLPRLTPLGILELPDNDAASPRVYPRGLRIAAFSILAIFAAVVVATTAASLGRYCLTTDAGGSIPPRR